MLVRYLGRKSVSMPKEPRREPCASHKRRADVGIPQGEMTPLRRINDLQHIDGKVYANIWEADRLAVIDPASGLVERFVELKGLLDTDDEWIQKWSKSDRCLNGIAYDEVNRRLFVTGKMWTKLFEIEVIEGGADREEGVCLCACVCVRARPTSVPDSSSSTSTSSSSSTTTSLLLPEVACCWLPWCLCCALDPAPSTTPSPPSCALLVLPALEAIIADRHESAVRARGQRRRRRYPRTITTPHPAAHSTPSAWASSDDCRAASSRGGGWVMRGGVGRGGSGQGMVGSAGLVGWWVRDAWGRAPAIQARRLVLRLRLRLVEESLCCSVPLAAGRVSLSSARRSSALVAPPPDLTIYVMCEALRSCVRLKPPHISRTIELLTGYSPAEMTSSLAQKERRTQRIRSTYSSSGLHSFTVFSHVASSEADRFRLPLDMGSAVVLRAVAP